LLENSKAIAADTSSPAAGITAVVRATAAALASVIMDPIPTRSEAAAAMISGAAVTNDIPHLPLRHDNPAGMRRAVGL